MAAEGPSLGDRLSERVVEIRQRDPYTLVMTERRDDRTSVTVSELYRVTLAAQPPGDDQSAGASPRTDDSSGREDESSRLQWSYLGPVRSSSETESR